MNTHGLMQMDGCRFVEYMARDVGIGCMAFDIPRGGM
jgi:hypothetical protein